jgi:hypothetical protein
MWEVLRTFCARLRPIAESTLGTAHPFWTNGIVNAVLQTIGMAVTDLTFATCCPIKAVDRFKIRTIWIAESIAFADKSFSTRILLVACREAECMTLNTRLGLSTDCSIVGAVLSHVRTLWT